MENIVWQHLAVLKLFSEKAMAGRILLLLLHLAAVKGKEHSTTVKIYSVFCLSEKQSRQRMERLCLKTSQSLFLRKSSIPKQAPDGIVRIERFQPVCEWYENT